MIRVLGSILWGVVLFSATSVDSTAKGQYGIDTVSRFGQSTKLKFDSTSLENLPLVPNQCALLSPGKEDAGTVYCTNKSAFAVTYNDHIVGCFVDPDEAFAEMDEDYCRRSDELHHCKMLYFGEEDKSGYRCSSHKFGFGVMYNGYVGKKCYSTVSEAQSVMAEMNCEAEPTLGRCSVLFRKEDDLNGKSCKSKNPFGVMFDGYLVKCYASSDEALEALRQIKSCNEEEPQSLK